ncbi:MAG: proline-rich region, partial [Burkholderiales bacterium]|nr:proline-rich region [Burkholderiales bacterium]
APPASPPVYVEREQENWWYSCEQTRGYYPYVKECPAGWTRVPPAPPPAQ